MNYDSVLVRLKEERWRLSVTQEQMGVYIHSSQSSYSKVERGERLLAFAELKSMCEHGVDVHFIFTGQRCDERYQEFFHRLEYPELLGCMGVLASAVKYLYISGTSEGWEAIYRQVVFWGCVESLRESDGNVFYGLRKQLDYTQQKLADQLGVDIKKLRALETNRALPDSELVYKLYDMYHIPPAAVLKDAEGLANEISCLLEMMDVEEGGLVFRFLSGLHEHTFRKERVRI